VGVLSVGEGVGLFDAAVVRDEAVLVAARLDLTVLRAGIGSGQVPALLRGLITAPTRRVAAGGGGDPGRVLVQRLAGLEEAGRHREVLELVRSLVAVVLGHATADKVEAAKAFKELGFDSLTSVELRNRLNAATGLRLPATLVFDHPTLAELAGFVTSELSAGVGVGASELADLAEVSSPDIVAELYRQARETGRSQETNEVFLQLSRLRKMFGDASELHEIPQPVRLSSGDAGPHLVCFNPTIALTGPHVYTRFADAFDGRRSVSAFASPGFVNAEDLPATSAALISMQAGLVTEHVGDAPFVLIGYSSGGWIASEVAKHLHSLGIIPMGVVLLDTYAPGSEFLVSAEEALVDGGFERENLAVSIDGTRLTAMAWTCSLFQEWKPQELGVPSLLVRASEPMVPAQEGSDWQSWWDSASTVADAPGNHFTMMEKHVVATVGVIDDWLAGIADARP
jgi:polyene macrolide polyketide synthase